MDREISEKIIKSLLSLYYYQILTLEEYSDLVEKVIPHPNFGYFCGEFTQKNIDDFFNSKNTEENFLDLAHSQANLKFYNGS